MGWNVKLLESAEEELDQLPEGPRNEAIELLELLSEDPHSVVTGPLEGYADSYKIYFASDRYRMLVRIRNKTLVVIVFRIRKRDSRTYSGMRSPSKRATRKRAR